MLSLCSHEHVPLPCFHGNIWLVNNCFKSHYNIGGRIVYWYIVTGIWNVLACLCFLPGGLIESDFSSAIEGPWEQFCLLVTLPEAFWKVTNTMWVLIFLKSRNQRTQMLPVPGEQAGVRQMECTVLSQSQLTYTEHEWKERRPCLLSSVLGIDGMEFVRQRARDVVTSTWRCFWLTESCVL